MRNSNPIKNHTGLRGGIYLFTLALLGFAGPAFAQPSIGIGTTTPNSKAALDLTSTTKGVLFPSLTAAQQTTLAGMLTSAEKGLMVTDAATGKLVSWTGAAWSAPTPAAPLTAKAPLALTANTIKLNPGTNAGDLLSWDGNNWVNAQPVIQHFSFVLDNHQPYLAATYVISAFGVFPSQNDASSPFVGEIFLMGANFAPMNFFLCNGALLPIAQYSTLFQLVGTIYGGDGVTTFGLPDLQGRVPMHQGNNGMGNHINHIIGEKAGVEILNYSH